MRFDAIGGRSHRLLRVRFWPAAGKDRRSQYVSGNYKKDVLAYVQAHPGELINTRDASISAPSLKAFGSMESRYFVCLQATAADARKEKLVIFFSGRINQFIDAEGGQCSGAAYQPFPELLAELRHLKEKK